MKPSIRKTVTFIETTYIEGGRAPDVPVEMAGVAAVIQNPWVGRGFVENLRPEILTMAPISTRRPARARMASKRPKT